MSTGSNTSLGGSPSDQRAVRDAHGRVVLVRDTNGSPDRDAATILRRSIFMPLLDGLWSGGVLVLWPSGIDVESRQWRHAVELGLDGAAGRTLMSWRSIQQQHAHRFGWHVLIVAFCIATTSAVCLMTVGSEDPLWLIPTALVALGGAALLQLVAYLNCIGRDLDRMIALTADPCCLACGLSLHTAGRDGDGLTVCPRCDAAWRYPPLRPKCFTKGCDTDLTDAQRDEDGTATCPSCKQSRPVPSWR